MSCGTPRINNMLYNFPLLWRDVTFCLKLLQIIFEGAIIANFLDHYVFYQRSHSHSCQAAAIIPECDIDFLQKEFWEAEEGRLTHPFRLTT
jgi:hypothetical protein